MRIAIIDPQKCQPRTCAMQCIKFCPGVRMGDETVVISPETSKALISEELCTGCGICVKKCPYKAIIIVGLVDELSTDLIHKYGLNAFRLYRLPYPREHSVTGIVGQNGMGKTTIVKILSGEIVPNMGNLDGAQKEDILEKFRGTQVYEYFDALYKGEIKAVHKPQYVDSIPKVVKGSVGNLLDKMDERDKFDEVATVLELDQVLDRDIATISGGELQRLAIATAVLREGDLYIFDEPSSYLDVGQRLNVGRVIRDLAKDKRVLVVEHDLVVLDYLADYINLMYGVNGAYGIVSHPRTVRQGINVYLDGYLKEENIRFRTEPIRFEVRPPSKGWEDITYMKFKDLKKKLGDFSLEVKGGEIRKGEVIGVLGPNATGKTTFVKMLAGVLPPDEGEIDTAAKVSYKPQYIKPESDITVFEAITLALGVDPQFYKNEVEQPLKLDTLHMKPLTELSGGELQRVAIAVTLARDADIYLLDEPSAYLDVEQRLAISKIIRRFVEKQMVTCLVVDHDILFTDYISDRLMVFSGTPAIAGTAGRPQSKHDGMNAFLKDVDITFRRDQETGRPRANKAASTKDKELKAKGEYYYQV